jgi:hypothetical protein
VLITTTQFGLFLQKRESEKETEREREREARGERENSRLIADSRRRGSSVATIFTPPTLSELPDTRLILLIIHGRIWLDQLEFNTNC